MKRYDDRNDPCTREIRRVTWVGLAANLMLSGIKFAVGLATSSNALVADAVHSISDCTTDLAVLIGVGFWSRPADRDHPHGHLRLESLVTAFIGGVLAVAAAGLILNAITNLHGHPGSSPGWLAFSAAMLSIIVKETLYRWTHHAAQRCKSGALAANAWHHRTDALSSVPVALAVLGTSLNPSWIYLDHIAAIVVSLLIFQAAWKIAMPALGKLMDRGAPQQDLDAITRIASDIAGVEEIHGLRTRYVGHSGLQVDLHVLVEGAMTVERGHDISEEVKQALLSQGPDVLDVIVHLEPVPKTAPPGRS